MNEDIIVYDGKEYPTKVLEVTIDSHDDGWVHFYQIAPESLIDAMRENTGNEDEDFDEDSIEAYIDNEIYHYIEDQYWDLPDEVIAKKHLDLPMTLIKEEDI